MGFIGRRLTQELLAGGQEVSLLDNLHPQVHGCRSEPPPAGATFYLADVRDRDALERCLRDQRPSVVVHLAAETGTGQSVEEPSRHVGTNGLGTATLIEALANSGAEVERLILASSRAVYGEGLWERPDGTRFFARPRSKAMLVARRFDVEDDRGGPARFVPHDAAQYMPNPVSVYGSTKLLQEHLVTACGDNLGMRTTILRLQNVYGLGQSDRNPYTGIVVLFDTLARQHKTIEVYEDGLPLRDFIHVSDVVRALTAAVQQGRDGVYDVGSARPTTLLDLANRIAEIHDAPRPSISGRFRLGDIRSAYAARSATALWDSGPPVGLEAGLQEMASGIRLRG